ncbi:hypothetical protein ACFLRC_00870 [Candidatus Altiarchaeota archaeon]
MQSQKRRQSGRVGDSSVLTELSAVELRQLFDTKREKAPDSRSYVTNFGRHYPCMRFIAENPDLFPQEMRVLEVGVGFEVPLLLKEMSKSQFAESRPMIWEPYELVSALNQTGRRYSLDVWDNNPNVIDALRGQSNILIDNIGIVKNIAGNLYGFGSTRTDHVSPGSEDYIDFFLKGLKGSRSLPIDSLIKGEAPLEFIGKVAGLTEVLGDIERETGRRYKPEAFMVELPRAARQTVNRGAEVRDVFKGEISTEYDLVVGFNCLGGQDRSREELSRMRDLVKPGGIHIVNEEDWGAINRKIGGVKKLRQWQDIDNTVAMQRTK